MPDPSHADRTSAQRDADHAGLARLSETLVPALVHKLNASGLGELEVREDGWRIRLRRPAVAASGSTGGRRPERPRLTTHAPDRDPRAVREASPGSAAPLPGDPDERPRAAATSPAVGLFRPTASVGTRLEAGDRIGTVDVLGIPQDVVSPVDGILVEIMAVAGDAVEYGEPVAALEADPPATPTADADGEG